MTLSPATWLTDDPIASGAGLVNRRTVFVDGKLVGHLYGIEPSPYNANRPTAYRWVRLMGGQDVRVTRLAEARELVERLTP